MSITAIAGEFDTFVCPNGHTVEITEKPTDAPRGTAICCRRRISCHACDEHATFTISAGGDKTLTDGWQLA